MEWVDKTCETCFFEDSQYCRFGPGNVDCVHISKEATWEFNKACSKWRDK